MTRRQRIQYVKSFAELYTDAINTKVRSALRSVVDPVRLSWEETENLLGVPTEFRQAMAVVRASACRKRTHHTYGKEEVDIPPAAVLGLSPTRYNSGLVVTPSATLSAKVSINLNSHPIMFVIPDGAVVDVSDPRIRGMADCMRDAMHSVTDILVVKAAVQYLSNVVFGSCWDPTGWEAAVARAAFLWPSIVGLHSLRGNNDTTRRMEQASRKPRRDGPSVSPGGRMLLQAATEAMGVLMLQDQGGGRDEQTVYSDTDTAALVGRPVAEIHVTSADGGAEMVVRAEL